MGAGSSVNNKKYKPNNDKTSPTSPTVSPNNLEIREPESRFLHIVHFNDIYNLDIAYEEEPRGGARKFASQMKKYKQELAFKGFFKPLVLFSGDFVGPSLMSSLTQGAHLIDALNAIGADYGTFGNHELDYGYESLKARLKGVDDDIFDQEVGFQDYETSETQWISTNMTEVATGYPMGGSQVSRYALFEWGGEFGTALETEKPKSRAIKVGLLAVSENWLSQCSQLPPNTLAYEDYIESAKKTAKFLRQNGAEIVLAITHNRLSNDYKLMDAVPEIDLLLGGHDHFYKNDLSKRIVKSGEEWRWLSKVEIELKRGNPKPIVRLETVEIVSSMPDDIQITALCDKFDRMCEQKFKRVIFRTAVDFNPMEEYVRYKESALCNWMCDICVEDYSLQDGLQTADICILLGYSFAGKAVIPAGDFTLANLFSILPLPLTMCVVKITGQNVVDSLTEGCESLPEECGAIHHVNAALSYSIVVSSDGKSKPIVKDVLFKGQPIDLKKTYTVCLPSIMCTGKYGYLWNVKAERVVEEEFAPQLHDLITMYCKRNWKSSVPNVYPANPSLGRIKIETI